jgi:hypothetical protein
MQADVRMTDIMILVVLLLFVMALHIHLTKGIKSEEITSPDRQGPQDIFL